MDLEQTKNQLSEYVDSLALQIIDLEIVLEGYKQDYDKASNALSALRGDSSKVEQVSPKHTDGGSSPSPSAIPPPPPRPVDTRPICGACDDRMEPMVKELSNGRSYTALVCVNSSCNNEKIA